MNIRRYVIAHFSQQNHHSSLTFPKKLRFLIAHKKKYRFSSIRIRFSDKNDMAIQFIAREGVKKVAFQIMAHKE